MRNLSAYLRSNLIYVAFASATILTSVDGSPSAQQQRSCHQDAGSLSASIVAEERSIECEVEDLATLQAFKITDNTFSNAITRFSLGERIVLCFTLPRRMYVSVWDAPPVGVVERLYPNELSLHRVEKAAIVEEKTRSCIGQAGSGFNIEVSHREGSGRGQFYLIATTRIENHPDKDSFEVSDWQSVRASIVPEMQLEDLPDIADTYLVYEVR
ncbi:DUF4384 domain-containing protein [Marinivivus vitaminiproducens]|uniref:DUF4384 domain-containing protein n=1 Tax=Marinivivus vitaminiproducens TaxID=3035935 RepID=UPI0027A6495B|nr:DUF4384 domain-containing protein [Geminicoccaceae bacterium SCSIO 64248]